MKRVLPDVRTAARRLPKPAESGHWRPSFSAALFSSAQPLRDGNRQAQPRGAYYDLLLTSPPPYARVKSEGPPSTASAKQAATPTAPLDTLDKPAPALATPAAKPAPEETAASKREKASAKEPRIVFGSRLAGPKERAERLAEIRNRSKIIAGVRVPPKPEEPDNCCMSGCVDCVWDRYRDEMEEWATLSAEASRRLKAQEAGVAAGVQFPGKAPQGLPSAASMDDDGGGSYPNWDIGASPQKPSEDFWNDDLYKDVPVGIREFMKQEKRLKIKHMKEGTLGG